MIDYILLFLLGLSLTAVLSVFFEHWAPRLALLDVPGGRHQHAKPTPLVGGLAICLTVLILGGLTFNRLLVGNLTPRHWLGVAIGAVCLIIGGLLDDRYKLAPKWQLLAPLAAVAAVLWAGVSIDKIGNPFGGLIYLGPWLSGLLVSLWLLGMMYTTKLLDGLDGLVSGIGVIASAIIFLFTMTTRWYQPDIAWAALILASAAAGFLLRNWHPAKAFLGEGGSLLIGFLLGLLSIISGGKFAVALLIMGIPILDVAWTIIRRLLAKQHPLKTADRQHLHFRLLSAGLSVRQATAVFYVFAGVFGLTALFLQSRGKLLLLLAVLALMILLIFGFTWLDKRPKIG